MRCTMPRNTDAPRCLAFRNPRSPFRVGFRGFTLIELLVVIAIIITLLAILGPSMRGAMMFAQRTKCLTNQRSITHGLISYAADSLGAFPPYRLPGVSGWGDAYGLRDDTPTYYGPKSGRAPFNVGLAVTGGYLPVESLPTIIHCPSFDNSAAGGHCMDGVNPTWKGGSFWESHPDWRILSSYNYRGPSFQRNNNDQPPKLSTATGPFVMMIDTPDTRFRGWQSLYNEHGGYNYVTIDMSGTYLEDPTYEVDAVVAFFKAAGQRGTVDGRGGGGGWGNGTLDEAIYKLIADGP